MDKVESKIKNFFKRKKTQAQFKVNVRKIAEIVHLIYCLLLQTAGPGRKLTDGPSSSSSSKPTKRDDDVYVPPKRNELSAEAR